MAMSHKLDSDIQQTQNIITKNFTVFFLILRLRKCLEISGSHRTQNILTFNKWNVYSTLHLALESRLCLPLTKGSS